MKTRIQLDAFSTRELQREFNKRILSETTTDELYRELARRETPLQPLARSRAPRAPKVYSPVVRLEEETTVPVEPTSLDRSSNILALVNRNYGPGKPHTRRNALDYSDAEAS